MYPAYRTLLAINSESKEDDTQWLCYWVFYGIFSTIESITDIFLFWVPAYELLKMVFYVYLYSMNGAQFLYIKLLKPLVLKMEQFDRQTNATVDQIKNTVLHSVDTAGKKSK